MIKGFIVSIIISVMLIIGCSSNIAKNEYPALKDAAVYYGVYWDKGGDSAQFFFTFTEPIKVMQKDGTFVTCFIDTAGNTIWMRYGIFHTRMFVHPKVRIISE
jgi:hypothetical protein